MNKPEQFPWTWNGCLLTEKCDLPQTLDNHYPNEEISLFNPFHGIGLFLYPQKTSENSSIDIGGMGTVLPGNKVNPKSTILDILFSVVFYPTL